MQDIVGNLKDLEDDESETAPCLIFEWMDCTLKEVPSERYKQDNVLLKAIVDAALSSLVVLSQENLVHTGKSPLSFISGLTKESRLETRQHLDFQY